MNITFAFYTVVVKYKNGYKIKWLLNGPCLCKFSQGHLCHCLTKITNVVSGLLRPNLEPTKAWKARNSIESGLDQTIQQLLEKFY